MNAGKNWGIADVPRLFGAWTPIHHERRAVDMQYAVNVAHKLLTLSTRTWFFLIHQKNGTPS